MRILIGVILVAALGWSTYWWIGARATENNLRDWLDQRAESGWVATYAAVETRGFPNRFDTTIMGPELSPAGSDVTWRLPFLKMFRFSYQPNHIIAAWPNSQTIITPSQTVEVASEHAQASFVFKNATDLELDRSTFEFSSVVLGSSNGWQAEIGTGIFATRDSARVPGAIDMVLNAEDLRLSNRALSHMAEAGIAPGMIQRLQIDTAVTFDAPWNRRAIVDQRPQVQALELEAFRLNWGKLDITAAGDLTFDDLGRASGTVTVTVKNWQDLLQPAVAFGWLPEAMEPTVKSVLAGLSGPDSTLDTQLTLTNGSVSFGSIPIGTIAPLILR